MNKSKKTKRTNPQKVTVAVRVPTHLRQYYVDLAAREIRDLSEVLRIALEDQAKVIQGRGDKLLAA